MDSLERFQQRVHLAREGHSVMSGVTTAGIGYALIRQNPALAKMGGAAAIMTGAAGLAMHDEVRASKAGSAALIVGGLGLIAAGTPTGRCRAALVAATGALMNLASEQGNFNVIAHRNMVKGAIIGTMTGIGVAMGRRSVAGAAVSLAASAAVGIAAGNALDNSREVIAPENVMPLVRMSPQLMGALR